MGCASSRTQPNIETLSDTSFNGLAKNLVWLQEKSLQERYEVLDVIGKGSIGEVSVVRRKPQSHQQSISSGSNDGALAPIGGRGFGSSSGKERRYAMKTIYVSRMTKARLQEFENEVAILQRLHHPNIIHLREVFLHKRQIYMLMDLCTGGQLNARKYTEDQVCSVVTQILRALAYMHDSVGICHRDLKMENIMLESPEDPLVVKLIDFGLSQVFARGEALKTIVGTVYTMAPEVLLGSGYTQQSDIWSVGVIAFYLLCGEYPFLRDEKDFNDEDLVQRLVTGRFEFAHPLWLAVTQEGRDLVINLLRLTPGFRWSAKRALSHCRQWEDAVQRGAYENMQRLLAVGSDRAAANGNGVGTVSVSGANSSEGAREGRPWSAATREHASNVDVKIATSIRSFAGYGELKKAALMITAFQLEKEELHHLKAAFLEIDTEENGVITYPELQAVLRKQGVDDAEIERLFASMDQDRSGLCSYMEFLAATLEARGFIEEDRLLETFQRLDVDNSGYISRANLKVLMGPLYPDAMLDAMMKEGDPMNTGSISLDSFVRLMRPTLRAVHSITLRELLGSSPSPRNPSLSGGAGGAGATPRGAASIWGTPPRRASGRGGGGGGSSSHCEGSVVFASIRIGELHCSMAALSQEASAREAAEMAKRGISAPPPPPLSDPRDQLTCISPHHAAAAAGGAGGSHSLSPPRRVSAARAMGVASVIGHGAIGGGGGGGGEVAVLSVVPGGCGGGGSDVGTDIDESSMGTPTRQLFT